MIETKFIMLYTIWFNSAWARWLQNLQVLKFSLIILYMRSLLRCAKGPVGTVAFESSNPESEYESPVSSTSPKSYGTSHEGRVRVTSHLI